MTDHTPDRRGSVLGPVALRVAAVVGAAFIATIAAGVIKPVDLLLPGSLNPAATVVRRDFNASDLAPNGGYDGQQYYAVAAELPDLDAAAQYLDSPRYRLERILAPAIASLAPRGDATVLALLGLNVVGIGLACGALAELCTARGWPPALGLLAIVPLLVALFTSCVDPLSTGLALAAIALVERRAVGIAAVLFAAGALTREGVVFVIVAVALGLAIERRKPQPSIVLLTSLVPLAVWHLYLSVHVGGTFKSKTAVLAVLHQPAGSVLITVTCLGLCLGGTLAWRHRPVVAAAVAVTALQTPFFAADILDWAALPRVTAIGLAPSLAALGALALRSTGGGRVRQPARPA